MSAAGRPKRILLRWDSFRGYAAIAVFTLITIIFETFVIYVFLKMGLKDTTPIIQSLRLPGTQFTFTLVISSLFHLLPLGVILVLVSCWIYLTKAIALPRRKPSPKPARRIQPLKRRGRRSIWNRIDKWISMKTRGLSRAVNRLVNGLQLRKVTIWFEERLFVKATLKSGVTVILSFIMFVFAAYLMEHPTAIYNWIHDYYMKHPDTLNFIFNTSRDFGSTVKGIAPLYIIGNAVNSVILGVAPHLWIGLGGLGGPVIQYLASLDLASKYTVCQNLAAWLCAISTLTYGWYLTRKPGFKRKRP